MGMLLHNRHFLAQENTKVVDNAPQPILEEKPIEVVDEKKETKPKRQYNKKS